MTKIKWNNVNFRMDDALLSRLNVLMGIAKYTARHLFLQALLDHWENKPITQADPGNVSQSDIDLIQEKDAEIEKLNALIVEKNAEITRLSAIDPQSQNRKDLNGIVLSDLTDQENDFVHEICDVAQATPSELLIRKILIKFCSFFPQQIVNVPSEFYDVYKKHFRI